MGSFWGLNYLGVDPATGDAIYEDLNGDGTINNSDAMIIGNAQPDLIGGYYQYPITTRDLTFHSFSNSLWEIRC